MSLEFESWHQFTIQRWQYIHGQKVERESSADKAHPPKNNYYGLQQHCNTGLFQHCNILIWRPLPYKWTLSIQHSCQHCFWFSSAQSYNRLTSKSPLGQEVSITPTIVYQTVTNWTNGFWGLVKSLAFLSSEAIQAINADCQLLFLFKNNCCTTIFWGL